MSTGDLEQEYARCVRAATPRHVQKLQTAGVSDFGALYQKPPMWGAGMIEPDTDGLFRWTDARPGRQAVILPIGWEDGGGWWNPLEDMCAFYLDRPGTWFLNLGCTPILGPDAAHWAEVHGEPLSLFSTPLDWLKARGRGCCIVDWRIVPGLWFGAVPEIHCDSPALAARLMARWRECEAAPPVIAPTPERAAA